MPTTEPRSTLRQRLFARMMSAEDEESQARYGERKERLLGTLRGRVLELGPGTGVNLEFLHPDVEWTGIEPNPEMRAITERRARKLGRTIAFIDELPGEELAESFDAAVSTLVLCSVPDPEAFVLALHRALVPGGRLVFIEHVVDPHRGLRRCIQKVAPYTPWRYFSDGCNPARDLEASIRAAGFRDIELEAYDQEGKGWISAVTRPHISGFAVKGLESFTRS